MKKRLTSIVLVAALALTLFGCGQSASKSASQASSSSAAPSSSSAAASSAAPSSAASSAPAKKAPTPPAKATMLVNYKATEAPSADNPLLKAVKDYTGTALEITWVPQDAFEEKINTLMASQQLPELTTIREIKSSGFINAARAGMFWDMTPYVSQFTNMSKIDKNVLKNVQTDGKQYLIPKIRQTARMGGIIRTDWLENVGLKMPTTLDEVHEVLKAFTEKDPDKNGAKDTVGLSMNNKELKNDLTLLSVYMGGCNTWQVNSDGTFTSQYKTDTYNKALTMFHDWFAEGLINKDFAINDDELTNFTSGKAGMMWMGNVEDASTRMTKLTEINPKATVDIFQILTEKAGGDKHIVGYQGYTGNFAIPTTSVKSEDEVLSLMAFLDKMGDDKMTDLINYGIEGSSYTVSNGGVSQTKDQLTVYSKQFNQLRQITPFYTFVHLQPVSVTPLASKITSLMTEDAKYTVFNPALPFISETETETGGSTGELATLIQDACTNYVIGELSLENYQATVKKWEDGGGTKIGQEFAEQYKASSKK